MLEIRKIVALKVHLKEERLLSMLQILFHNTGKPLHSVFIHFIIKPMPLTLSFLSASRQQSSVKLNELSYYKSVCLMLAICDLFHNYHPSLSLLSQTSKASNPMQHRKPSKKRQSSTGPVGGGLAN